jgi:hypothetical protein
MIKFEHDGSHISYQKTCWKGYDGTNVPRWNLEIEPFIAQRIVEREENTPMLRVVENHKPPRNVVGKGRIKTFQIMFLSLESFQRRRVHRLGSMTFGLTMQQCKSF